MTCNVEWNDLDKGDQYHPDTWHHHGGFSKIGNKKAVPQAALGLVFEKI